MWDILYYIFLKMILDWPESLATWDVLFLIPVPWIGPVWAPVVVSLALVGAGSYLFWTSERPRRVTAVDWAVEIAAGFVVILSFTLQWRVVVAGRMPDPFPATVFWAGWSLALAWFLWRERQERTRA